MEDTQTVRRAVIFDIPMSIITFTGARFFEPFLQTIRCHALLWFLGVRHGDISVSNLMVNPISEDGILSDFDLATTVDSDTIDVDPSHGVNPTGTMVFMSLELLREVGQQGRVPTRLYRHDLESFCWVLFWIGYCYDNGKFRPRYPCTEWINVTPAICHGLKCAILQTMGNVKATNSYIQYQFSLAELVAYWVYFHNKLARVKSHKSRMNMEGVDTGKPRRVDISHVVVTVEETFEEPSDILVLRNILDRLPRSRMVDMQWAQIKSVTYTIVSRTYNSFLSRSSS
ncbi:hypothetical protein QCA50_009017 [Cerrena zonata]|uniref:Fungal-type protein kinase domain-containing protein n=1 Tax=Cerrena zonata TaxID=2478898 RepID=A0AAW0GCX3_9APHY